jgi:hypothetical protein
MTKHITIVAALRIGSAVMSIIIAGIILLLLIGPGVMVQCMDGDAETLMILSAIAFTIAFFFMLSAALNVVGGIGF